MGGFLRNNMTGAQYNFDDSPDVLGQSGAQFSQPVDYMGKKGYWTPDGSIVGINPDGSVWKAMVGVDWEASNKATMQNLEMQDKRMRTAHTQEQILSSQAQRGLKEGIPGFGIPQVQLEKQFGKAPEGFRWTTSGTLEKMEGGPNTQDANAVQEFSKMAGDLLNKGDATGSYIGLGAKVGLPGLFGIGTDAAKDNAQLKAIEGMLVSKMPKMSGPQSDKDVMLYKQMAGQIGDPTTPIEVRKAALETVKALNAKYASGGYGQPMQQSPQLAPGTVKGGYVYVGGDPASPNSWKLR